MASNIPMDDVFVVVIDTNFYTPVAMYDPRFHLKKAQDDSGMYNILIQSLGHARREAITYRGESREQQKAEEEAEAMVINELKKMLDIILFVHVETKNFIFFLGVPRKYERIGSGMQEIAYAEKLELRRANDYKASLTWISSKVQGKYGKTISEWDGNAKDGLLGKIEEELYRLMFEVHH